MRARSTGQTEQEGKQSMKIRKVFLPAIVGLLCLGTLAPSSTLASATLPTGAGDFVSTINLGSTLAELAQVGSTQCSIVSTNVAALPVGDTLAVPVEPMKGLALVNGLKSRSDSLVTMSCAQSISMAGTERIIPGTITSEALSLSGTFTLACTFQENIKVVAELTAGLQLAKGVTVIVKSADKAIPMVCSMSATFPDGTSMSGTVDGLAKVGSAESDACVGDTQLSCVPLAIEANVKVTSTMGKLSGYSGSGVYSLAPSFTIAKLNDELGLLKSSIGKSSVTVLSARVGRLVPRTAQTTGKMSINFARGASRTDIVHPAVKDGTSTLGVGSYLAAAGPRASKCSFSVTRGKKSFALAAVSTSATGITPTKTVTAAQYGRLKKALAAKAGTALKLGVVCGTTKSSQTIRLG